MRRIAVRRAAGAVVLVALAGLVSACGGEDASEKAGQELGEQLAEKAMEDSGLEGVDVDVDGEEVTVESEEGTYSMGTGEVPEGFPDDVTLPDGEIVSSVETPEGGLVSIAVDDVAGAFDALVGDMEGTDWNRDSLSEAEGTHMAVYSRGDESLMVLGDEASGQLSVTHGAI